MYVSHIKIREELRESHPQGATLSILKKLAHLGK